MTEREQRRTRSTAAELSLGEFVRERYRDILDEWAAEVRRLPVASHLDRPALLDHIPHMLERIAEMADSIARGTIPQLPTEDAQRHADFRLDEGFDLPQVVAEFAILRDCIMRLWEQSVVEPQHLVELRVVNQAIDKAVTASVVRFTTARDRTMMAIDRIALEALESKNLDDLLRRLLEVFVELTAAVDTAAILIRERDELRVRAVLGLDREHELGLSMKVGEGFSGTIARDKQALTVAPDRTDITIKSKVLRTAGLRALHGVPLIDGGNLVGVAHMGSLTAHEFSRQDRRLLSAVASRATSAIYQHVLRESAERSAAELSAILESIPAAVYIGNAQEISRANSAGLELLGYTDAAQLATRPVHSLVDALDIREPATGERLDVENGPVRTAVRGKRYDRDLIVHDHTNDRDAIVHSVAAPVSLDGTVIGAVAVNIDVTARHRIEATLRERELEFRTLADNIPQLAWIADATGSIYWFNQRWFDYTGTQLSKITGSEWRRVHHPDHVDRVLAGFRHAIEHEREWEDLFPLRSHDGHYRWFLSRAMPVHDDHGRVQRWFGTNTDVTEQRFLLEASAVLASQLGWTETLAQIVELAIPDIADTCVVDVIRDARLERIAGGSVDRDELARLYPPALDTEGLGSVLRTGEAVFDPGADHMPRLRELGVSSCIVAPLAARGQTLGAITLMRTGTRRFGRTKLETAIELGRRAGNALDNAQLFLASQDAIRARDEILAIVSHDMRNPLASIDLAAQMTLMNHELPAQATKHLEMIERSASRMERLLQDLLDTSSLQVGKLAIERKRVNATALVASVVTAHEQLAATEGVQLVRECKLDGLAVDGDLDRLVQAIGNLVGNAIKFSRRGDTVTIRASGTDGHVMISVSDTGPGIPPDEISRIFEPYWSSKRHAKKGTGLGLHICKAIVELHGGTVSVESTLGAGTTFVVRLPSADA